MKLVTRVCIALCIASISCAEKQRADDIKNNLSEIELLRGDITLCGTGDDEFGSVAFNLSCNAKTQRDFNLGLALLHSFEYSEAEKVFAGIIDQDPTCAMAYWGVAMSNFHPLWAPPSEKELIKGQRIIALARSLVDDSTSVESRYIEAVAKIYDDWKKTDHKSRVKMFENASRKLYEQYAGDTEAAVFYALALNASADPADKLFVNQKKAGEILNNLFKSNPNHPGIAHYLIHNFDYPELAELGLPAAKKYAAVAAASAHAQHMPSHIFTRLGLWDESIASNLNSISAAQCYVAESGLEGHWDEELHGMDYLTYALLQKGDDHKALEQVSYLASMEKIFPHNFKVGYTLATMPARYAVERKDWANARELSLPRTDISWDKFPWERSNIHFARFLGAVNTKAMDEARLQLKELEAIHHQLNQIPDPYKANLVEIQIKTARAWILLKEGKQREALALMSAAADMEDATAKHPVTPGEIVPARELLADMMLEIGDAAGALKQYENNLRTRPNRYNGLVGAATAAQRAGEIEKAATYANRLFSIVDPSSKRSHLAKLQSLPKEKL